APGLRVLLLVGPERRSLHRELKTVLENIDVVLTSYPVLLRDKENLKQHEFHLVVLDEAQNIKNPAAAVTHAAYVLNARHRLCLSGTPVENNLEELWSLFRFLMPGFLSDLGNFRKNFRVPIEQYGNRE